MITTNGDHFPGAGYLLQLGRQPRARPTVASQRPPPTHEAPARLEALRREVRCPAGERGARASRR